MKVINIGLTYDSVEVAVTEGQTVKQVYESAGKGHLLQGRNVQLNNRPVSVDATIGSLNVSDGDYLCVSDKLKSACK